MTVSIRRLLFSKVGFIGFLTILGVYFLMNLSQYVNFGIDLVGGTYITLQVQTEKAYENRLYQELDSALTSFQAHGGAPAIRRHIADTRADISFDTPEAAERFAQDVRLNSTLLEVDKIDGSQVVLNLSAAEQRHIASTAVERNIQALKGRLDQFGVGEILIAAKGDQTIVIELPNVQDPQAAKKLIGKPSMLEIKPVLDAAATKEMLLDKYGGELPDETDIVRLVDEQAWLLVPRRAEVTGEYLKDARMTYSGEIVPAPAVAFEFTDAGAQLFYDLTTQNIGNQLAIIIDNVAISAPSVNQAIRHNGIISSSSFTPKSAQELALMLRSGAFVAPVTFEEERTIGPSLGAEAIRQGLMACLVGLGLLFVFSIWFYRVAGLLAFVVLLYNLLLILVFLSLFGATLTLPGIAGMILTVGMAIDASILIFERIKEELARGISFKQAVSTGFSGAMTVILDANITHLIISLVLYWMGSGPLQGFAVTMIVGIISTLITGLWLLRSLFSVAFDIFNRRQISL